MFRIAETIGCSVSEVRNTMPRAELNGWAAYFELKDKSNG